MRVRCKGPTNADACESSLLSVSMVVFRVECCRLRYCQSAISDRGPLGARSSATSWGITEEESP